MKFDDILNLALETIEPEDKAGSQWAKSGSQDREKGKIGPKTFSGEEDKVKIKFDPDDPDIKGEYIEHTHPIPDGMEPSVAIALPSHEDLEVAMDHIDHNIAGIIVYTSDGRYQSKLTYTDKIRPNADTSAYKQVFEIAAKDRTDENIQRAIDELKKLGFDVDIIDHEKSQELA